MAFRTVHLMAFGVLLGGHVFRVEPGRLAPALWITVLSGAALMGLEIAKSVHWLVMGKGIAVLVKLALLLLVPVFWEARVALLLAVVTIASVGAHMPARYRHYSVLHRRVLEPAPLSTGSAPTDDEVARHAVGTPGGHPRPECGPERGA